MSYIPTNDPNTAGKSYPYHIYGEYTRPSTFSYSLYKTAGEYPLNCPCGPIVDPVPVGLKPECFYHLKPHAMNEYPSPSGSYFGNKIPYYASPYVPIYQPPYSVQGLANAPNWKIKDNDYLPYMNQRL